MRPLEEDSIPTIPAATSQQLTLSTTRDSNITEDTQVEFSDVIEKLNSAIGIVKILTPWKEKALKAELENRQLRASVNRLKDDLLDTEYEVDKWKKRALRAEQENQEEIIKWKNKAVKARTSKEIRDDIDLINIDDDDTFTNLVSERDDDNSTLSSRKDLKLKNVKSFRSKWRNIGFHEESNVQDALIPVIDDDTTVAAEQIIETYESGLEMFERKASHGRNKADDQSSIEAEEILNNYLQRKGRYHSRRFDSSGRYTTPEGRGRSVVSGEVEI